MKLEIIELDSSHIAEYKEFFKIGLIEDEYNFRISPKDEETSSFPTRDLDDSFTLASLSDGKISGVLSFIRDGSDREKLKHKGLLFRMYVSPQYRGHGIAKKLIQTLIDRVKNLEGVEQINLTVVANNDSARSLYSKFGFVSYGFEKRALKWKNVYLDEEFMVLYL